MRHSLKVCFANFKEQKRLYRIYIAGQYLAVFCAITWKRSQKKNGASLDIRILRRMRHNLTLHVQTFNDQMTINKAGKVFREFLDDQWHLAELFHRFRVFYRVTLYIQKHIRAQIHTRYAKVDVLKNYWEKVIIHLQLKATEQNDKKCNELCRLILLIPPEVQFEVLKQWVKGCRDLHAIAFF